MYNSLLGLHGTLENDKERGLLKIPCKLCQIPLSFPLAIQATSPC